jgi:hypothetical protein
MANVGPMSSQHECLMRFAYIDSQGNEVAIPSVDALALRIELGAIGPDTELFDAQSDRWGRADSHEIYHTLARDVSGETFLVPTPPPAPDESTENPTEEPIDEPATPADPPPPTSAADLGLTLAPDASDEDESAGAELPAPGAPPEPAGFGDMELGLTPGPTDGVPDDTMSMDEGDAGSEGALDELPISYDPTADDDASEGGLDLEPPLDFGTLGSDAADFGGGLDLEPPMSDFDPGAPPAWMEQEGPGGMGDDEGVMDFSGLDEDVGGQSGSPDVTTSRPDPDRRVGSTRPSRPPPRRRPSRRRSAKPLLLLLALVATGVAGWYGWQQFGDRIVPPPSRPAVVIPVIPAELETPLREIADQALVTMFEEIEAETFGADAPEAPPEEWLAGIYLGNASGFESVRAFWAGYRSFTDRLRAEGAQAFHDAYVALADSSDLEADVVPLLVERADSGFLASREDRVATYELMGSLTDAALGLHDFLLLHEADIVYTPALGFSGNPVEEAVPATEEIGDRMWDLVEEITNALDRLGTLDRVTRDRLNDVLLARIRETGIR